MKDQHGQEFNDLSKDYELMKLIIARRSKSVKQVRSILQSLHVLESQIVIAEGNQKTIEREPQEVNKAFDNELFELVKRREAARSIVYNLKEETVFANLKRVEITEEIEAIKTQHSHSLEALKLQLEAQREIWREAEAFEIQSSLDYKKAASQQANKLEEDLKAGERVLSKIKQEIEIARRIVQSNSPRKQTFYGTLKEFVAAGIDSPSNSRRASVTTRLRTVFVRAVAPKTERPNAIKLNSSFSIRSCLDS